MARHTIMKIHFELNTISRGINRISKWNTIVNNPVSRFNSYFVYITSDFRVKVLTKKVNTERLKNTVRVIAAAIRTLVGD